MALKDDVQRRLQALLDEAPSVTATKYQTAAGEYLHNPTARRYATKAKALLESTFGADSVFAKDATRFAQEANSLIEFEGLWGAVAAALDAWRDGYVFTVHAGAEAEVEGSLLETAQDLASKRGVNEPERRGAAFLAGSVLERHLRAVHTSHGGKKAEELTIEPLGNELKKLHVIDEVQRKRISAIGASRNSAAHDAVFNDTAADVKRLIETVADICARLR
jgi:hypothetical protein